jgi:hypothetical protein
MKELGAFAILFLIFAVSDYISYKTKAIVSMLFAASVILLAGLWLGLPKTIFADSGLAVLGAVGSGLIITHMGTLISLKELIAQWKTVLIALGALVGIFIFVFLIGQLFVGQQYAVASTPPIAGGVIAALMMSEAAKAHGLPTVALLAVLLLVLQGFAGYPIASFCLKKEGKRLAGKYDSGAKSSGSVSAKPEIRPKYRIFPPLNKDLQTNSILLAKLALIALLAYWVAGLLNNVINRNIMFLIFGIAFAELGLLEKDILTKSNSFGLAMAGLLVLVFSSLVNATPTMVLQLIVPIVITLVLGVIGIALGSILVGKLLGESWAMSFAIGTTALFGFPGTYIVSSEVAKVLGKSDDEKKFIMEEIFPKMMVAGFVTVTIGSVVLAGIMVNLL